MAVTTEETPTTSPRTHSTTAPAMVPSISFSSRLMGPILARSSCACLGASGVSFSSGGFSCKAAPISCFNSALQDGDHDAPLDPSIFFLTKSLPLPADLPLVRPSAQKGFVAKHFWPHTLPLPLLQCSKNVNMTCLMRTFALHKKSAAAIASAEMAAIHVHFCWKP